MKRYYTIVYYQLPYFKLFQNKCFDSQKYSQTTQSNIILLVYQPISIIANLDFWVTMMSFPLLNPILYEFSNQKNIFSEPHFNTIIGNGVWNHSIRAIHTWRIKFGKEPNKLRDVQYTTAKWDQSRGPTRVTHAWNTREKTLETHVHMAWFTG